MDNNELLQQVAALIREQTEMLSKQIQESETRTNMKIENEVAKRIESLFDGYKLTHEKQWELEKRIEAIEKKLEMVG